MISNGEVISNISPTSCGRVFEAERVSSQRQLEGRILKGCGHEGVSYGDKLSIGASEFRTHPESALRLSTSVAMEDYLSMIGPQMNKSARTSRGDRANS